MYDRAREHRWEVFARYGAAYACTLITIAAVRPIISTPFTLLLAAITLLGLPISLSLIYKVVAERLGFRAWGVGLPGHFLIGSRREKGGETRG